ncbi:uncharacterized protein Dere_GG24276 [Drosophila erecta]|uniref:GP-PDE domain-containing protein n=1 Tax=Drosophila erecta TaxID=7220 RepID=B3N584_DROER|nr:uncharacterized protein Dere_GG24276 [Drosophila erecta]
MKKPVKTIQLSQIRTIRVLQQKLALEKSSSSTFRNISVTLMKELDERKSEILKDRQANLDLEIRLNDANRKILELNLELQDARRSVKPCDKKKNLKDLSLTNKQLLEEQIKKNYRNMFVKLMNDLRLTINSSIWKIVNMATNHLVPDIPPNSIRYI